MTRLVPAAFILAAGALSLSAFLTSEPALAAPGDRPWALYAADLGVPEATFRACFSGVSPDPGHAPSGATQRANKEVFLPCLQAENPSITNDMLDMVMDRYRPERPNGT